MDETSKEQPLTGPSCVGVLAHPKRPQTAPVAEQIADSLRQRGVDSWLHTAWEEEDVIADVQRADVVVAIGGDGAMLQASRVCAPYAVPVLGVNMGRLGFLTEIARPDNWPHYMERLLQGDYWVERRMMITARVGRGDQEIARGNALNDVVISGNQVGHMIQLDVFIDGHWATTYNADALVVSTPTGSTAYALSIGGPILPPDLSNILIVPLAPHLSMDRPIVLSEGSRVTARPLSSNRYDVVITVDGAQLITLQPGDWAEVRACELSSRFIRMRDRNYFYRSLLDRLEPRVNRDPEAHDRTVDQVIKDES